MGSTAEEPEACPLCEASDLETSVYGFDGLCQACGFVLEDSTTANELPEWAHATDSPGESETRSWQDYCRITNATEARLAEAFELVEEFSDHLPLPVDLREAAAETYASAFCAELTDGRATADMVAACLRVGSVQIDMPLPTGRLTALANVSETTFRKCRRDLQAELETETPAVSPAQYLWIFASELAVDQATRTETREFLESLSDEPVLVGKSPAGIAAAGLYLTAEGFTQQAVATVAGVSTETIRLRRGDFEEVVT